MCVCVCVCVCNIKRVLDSFGDDTVICTCFLPYWRRQSLYKSTICRLGGQTFHCFHSLPFSTVRFPSLYKGTPCNVPE